MMDFFDKNALNFSNALKEAYKRRMRPAENGYGYPLNEEIPIYNLRDILLRSAEKYKNNTAFLTKDARAIGEEVRFNKRGKPDQTAEYSAVTHGQFAEDSFSLLSALLKLQEKPERIALLAETRYEWYLGYMAAVCGAGTAVPLEKELGAEEIKNLLNRAKADTLICSSAKKADVIEIIDEIENLKTIIYTDKIDEQLTAAVENNPKKINLIYFWDLLARGREIFAADQSVKSLPIDIEKCNILLFTSGTTARSKAVMQSHKNICSNVRATLQMVYIDQSDVFLSMLPLHHTYECTCGFLCAITSGAAIAICDGLRHITKNMKEASVTVVLVVPLILEAFNKNILKAVSKDSTMEAAFKAALTISKLMMKLGVDKRRVIFKEIIDQMGGALRLIICGGAPVDAATLRRFNEYGFDCIQGYGITESSPIVAVNRDGYNKPEAAGLVMPGSEVKIINKSDDGYGEIISKSDSIMLGYYEDPEKTAEVLDEDGFFHTGDLGKFDEKGFLHVVGRQANLIVTKNGKNIYPEELETLLLNYPVIQECVVYPEKGKKDSVEIWAEIYPSRQELRKNPETANVSLTGNEVAEIVRNIIKEINRDLVNYKHILNFKLRDTEFEKTASKKIKRRAQIDKESNKPGIIQEQLSKFVAKTGAAADSISNFAGGGSGEKPNKNK